MKNGLRNLKHCVRKLRNRRKLRLISFSVFEHQSAISQKVIHEGKSIRLSKPRIVESLRAPFLRNEEVEDHNIPAVRIDKICDCEIIGGVNALIADGCFVVPDFIRTKDDVFRIELAGLALIDHENQKVQLTSNVKSRKPIEKAVCIIAECSSNYAHFMVEVLPRFLLVDEMEEYRDVPIVLDWMVPEKFLDYLKFHCRREREFIRLKSWQFLKLQEAHVVSCVSYVPTESRRYWTEKLLPEPSVNECFFSPEALTCVKRVTNKKFRDMKVFGPKNICLVRNGDSAPNRRNMLNYQQVVETAKSLGFYIVDPSDCSILEQQILFSNAEVIISEIGAALINSVFSPEGCQLICFSAIFENASYYYFSNLAAALNHEVEFCVGKQVVDDKRHTLHQDYWVDLDGIENYLRLKLNSFRC